MLADPTSVSSKSLQYVAWKVFNNRIIYLHRQHSNIHLFILANTFFAINLLI